HTRSDRDWSSDVCSSDLPDIRTTRAVHEPYSDAYAVAEILHRSVDDVGGVEKPRDRITRGRPSAERRDAVPRHDIERVDVAELRSEERRVGKECRARWSQ